MNTPRLKFPTMLRKMWSGAEVQDWIDRHLPAVLEESFARLKDPVAVHVALLRGDIAKPDVRDMLHAYGAEALSRWDSAESKPAPGRIEVLKWPELDPDCWCLKCDRETHAFPIRMNLCPECGDKRCPRAADHTAACATRPAMPPAPQATSPAP